MQTPQADPHSNKGGCPYAEILSHIGRVHLLAERIMVPQTTDVSVAWRWFQNGDNLQKVNARKGPVWQDDGIDNRLAFAGLVGNILPDFTNCVMQNGSDFFASEKIHDFLSTRFDANMSQLTKNDSAHTSDILDFEKRSFEKFALFLHETFGILRELWNHEVREVIKHDPDSRLALLNIAFYLCGDNPITKNHKFKSGKKQYQMDKNMFGISRHLGGGIMSLVTEFTYALGIWENLQQCIVSNEELLKYASTVHLGLLETMREFTGFARIAGEIGYAYEKDNGKNPREMMLSGKVGYSADFFGILEQNFMNCDKKLRQTRRC